MSSRRPGDRALKAGKPATDLSPPTVPRKLPRPQRPVKQAAGQQRPNVSRGSKLKSSGELEIEIIHAEDELAKAVTDLIYVHGYAAVARELKKNARQGSERRSDLSLSMIGALVGLLKNDPEIGSAIGACRFLSRAGGVPKFMLGTPKREGQTKLVQEATQIRSLYNLAIKTMKGDPGFHRKVEFNRRQIQQEAAFKGVTISQWAKTRAKARWGTTKAGT
jgi:hypothetical protein